MIFKKDLNKRIKELEEITKLQGLSLEYICKKLKIKTYKKCEWLNDTNYECNCGKCFKTVV